MARESKKRAGIRWRMWLGLAALAAVCVTSGMAAFRLHRYVMTDSRFVLSASQNDALVIQGLNHLTRSRVQEVFAADFGRSVFAVPLAERRRRLLAIDWVEDAVVSRIWPDRLLVRIRERRPVAFAVFPSGTLLVDAEGVLLDPPGRGGAPAQFSLPVLKGLRELEPEAQRHERVSAFLDFQKDMGKLSNDLSEIDVSNPECITVVGMVNQRAVSLIMGDDDFARRYRNFLSSYPEIQKASPEAGSFDLRLDDRITARN